MRTAAQTIERDIDTPSPASDVEETDSAPPVRGDEVVIYLTFDDGPSPVSTPLILDILDEYGVSATFFMTGYIAEARQRAVQEVHARGHVIANHSYSHQYDLLYGSAQGLIDEIERTETVFTRILGAAPERIFRFPAGSAATQLDNNPSLRDDIIARLEVGGWRYFDWNVSFGDSVAGTPPAPDELAVKVIGEIEKRLDEGEIDIIVLAHDMDDKPWTPRDLPRVLEYCIAQGFRFDVLSLDSPVVAFR